MTRNTRHQSTSWRRFVSQGRAAKRSSGRLPFHRRLRFEPLEDRRLLATITVNTPNDFHVDGFTTLREAIVLAAPGDTVDFSSSLTMGGPATIQLSNQGDLLITKSVTINGPGANLLTINAYNPTPTVTGDGTRIFNVDDGTGALIDVQIIGLSLTGGDAPFGENGGAILNREDLTVVACAISDSLARLGGGIWTAGNLTVRDSTISSNRTETTLGGVGGGIYSQTDLTTLTTLIINSTVSGNTGAALFNAVGKTVVQHSTIAWNERGIESVGNSNTLTEVYSTIIVRNGSYPSFSQDVRVTPSSFNSFHSLGYNVVGTGSTAIGAFNQSGDQVIGTADPLLGPLAYNGGPTWTHRLLAGCLAIDSGDPSAVAGVGGVPLYDQRGALFTRTYGPIDIGAYEREAALLLVVDTPTDENDGDYSPGDLSLREAIRLANEADGSTIVFDPTVFSTPRTIALTLGEFELTEALTISGPGQNLLTIEI